MDGMGEFSPMNWPVFGTLLLGVFMLTVFATTLGALAEWLYRKFYVSPIVMLICLIVTMCAIAGLVVPVR
jgi:hypothetical protein